MKLLNYILSFLPSFKRSDLQDDFQRIKDTLEQIALPVFDGAATFFKDYKLVGKDSKAFADRFKRAVKTEIRGDFSEVTYQVLQRVLLCLPVLQEAIKQNFAEDVGRGGITYRKANIVRYLEAVDFVQDYALLMMSYIYTVEFVAAGQSVTPLHKRSLDYLTQNERHFFILLGILASKPADLKAAIANIPDIVVDQDNHEVVEANVGRVKLDPMGLTTYGFSGNPVYHVRMVFAEWNILRYKRSQEELKMLQYKLLNMQQLAEGKQDPKLQQSIEYTQSRIENLLYDLHKMETRYE